MEQDWRLRGQEEYLRKIPLYKIIFPEFWDRAYAGKNEFYQYVFRYAQSHVTAFPDKKPYLEGDKIQLFWHEHCEFCWEKVMTNISCEFYCTKDMRHWICPECFEDFKKKFGWSVKPTEILFD